MEAAKKVHSSSVHSNNSDVKKPFLGIQAKLLINEPGDRFEAEADHAAEQVVNKEHAPKPYVPSLAPVQLKENDEEQQLVQEKPIVAGITPVVMRLEDSESSGEILHDNTSIDNQLRSSKGSGTKLSKGVKSEMEDGFGTDFNDVKIHTDERAVSMNRQIGAQAFTNGNDIYFNEGKFNPTNSQGKFLLAHELTHTIQQNGSESTVQRTGDDPVTLTSPLFQLAAFESVMKGELVIGRKNNGDDGSSGKAVKHINHALSLLYPDAEDKLLKDPQSYSKWTVKAVKRFQKEHGISVDGNVGKQTLLVLDAYHFQESVDQITYQANLRGKVQFLDDGNWEKVNSNGQFLQIGSGNNFYFIRAEEIAYIGANINPVEEVFGITAVGRGGTLVVSTGSGKAILIDAGYGNGVSYAVYESQLQNLLSQLKIGSITSIVVTHPHNDHINALEELIARYQIRASELVIGGQFQFNQELQTRLRNLANGENTRLLGYHRWDFAKQFEGARTGEYSVLAPINSGNLRISFFASEEAINKLNVKIENGKKITASEIDAASVLAKISSIGSELRLVVLGDLRGQDYLALEKSMDKSNPGSFTRLFQNVNVLSGMQHHLGRINNEKDFEGIMRMLEVTGGRVGELSVLVQSKGSKAQESFANALSRMGVTVYWTGTPSEGNLSGSATVNNSSEITVNDVIGVSRPQQSENKILNRVATISNLKHGIEALVNDSPKLMNDKQFARLRQAIIEADKEVSRLFLLRGKLTIATHIEKNESEIASIKLSETELQENLNQIMQKRTVDEILEENRELKETVNFMINTIGRAAEIEEELELMRTTGRSHRLVELIHAASPEYARAVLRSNPNVTAVRFFNLLEQQAELNRIASMGGGGGGRMSRAGAGILAVLVLAHDVILPAVVAFKSRNTKEKNEAWNIVLWWYEKGIVPDMIGYMGDTEITDKAELATLLTKGKLDGFSMTGLSSDNWQRFRLWLSANILNFEDYNRYFIADPVKVYSRSGEYVTDSKWALKLPTYSDGFTIKDVVNEEFTEIMDVTASEMTRNTSIELDQLLENNTKKKESNVTPTFSAYVEPSTESRAIGTVSWGNYTIFYQPQKRLHFKSGSSKEVYSFYDSDKVEITTESWWNNKDIVFFEVPVPEELKHWGSIPSGYKLVMGGNYNTYAQLKIENMSQYSKYPPVEMPGQIFDGAFWDWDEDHFSKKQKEAYERYKTDPINVKMHQYGNIKNMGYVITFPGNSANWHGLVLVKSADVE
jgi:peptidoglycan hydrolase-like protein with peptidoglycan-binding domain